MVLKNIPRGRSQDASAFGEPAEMLIFIVRDTAELVMNLAKKLRIDVHCGAVLHQKFGSSCTAVLHTGILTDPWYRRKIAPFATEER